MAEFSGKVALVTGGGSGIGLATALAFARAGSVVAVGDLDGEAAENAAEMVRHAGGKSLAATLDVTDDDAIQRFIFRVVDEFGGLDCAFNNAGISLEGMGLGWGAIDEYDRTVAVNQRAVLSCMTAELAHMTKVGCGAIVNCSSIAGMTGAGGAGYCASKHAVIGLTRSAALRHASQDIRVNAVCPGAIRTSMIAEMMKEEISARFIESMHPMGRLGEPEEIAEVVLFLCSSRASFITGQALAVDGGYMAK